MGEHGGVGNRLLEDFCRREGIDHLSLTPFLEGLVASGKPAYFAGDTHWSPLGQKAVLDPLLEWLKDRHVW